MTSKPDLRTALFLGMLLAGTAGAAEHDHASLGKVDFPVSCPAPAQEQFNQAITLLHHMTYPQARQAFEQITQAEPGCAMAHWGVAMTLFQPLWPTRPDALRWLVDGTRCGKRSRCSRARASCNSSTRRKPFSRSQSQPTTGRAFAVGNKLRGRHTKRCPATTRPRYSLRCPIWQPLRRAATFGSTRMSPRRSCSRCIRSSRTIRACMHYLVHANDVPGREHEFLEITRKYDSIAPDNPHALHMPTHIYTRVLATGTA